MESPGQMWRRWSRLWRRGAQEEWLDEEVRFHLERQTEKNLALGMTPPEARRAAVVRFGGVERVKEAARDELRPALVEDIARDFRYGLRTLLRAPGFAAVSVLTLGLGIGAATAIFTVVEGVLLRPLPYPEPDRVVRLFQINEGGNRNAVAEPNYEDWRAASRSFSALAEMAQHGEVTVLGGSEPARARVTAVSSEFFEALGVRPTLGRSFVPDEQRQGGTPAVVVSDAFWRAQLGGARELAGRTLTFNDRSHAVVGVMPAGFEYPGGTGVWYARELEPPSPSRTAHNFHVVARLAGGRTVEQAQAELSAISRDLKLRHGDETWMIDAAVVTLHEQLTAGVRPMLLLLLGAAAFLLLIACANVSSLLLARATGRRRELALRRTLGAGRARVARQLLAESLVLCAAGGVLGMWLAVAGVAALLSLEPGNLPRVDEIGVNWRVLLFSAGVCVATALVLALAMTARAGDRGLRGALTEGQRTMAGGRGSQRARQMLVVVQVALTVVLLAGAAVLGRSFLRLLHTDLGYEVGEALVLELTLPRVSDTPSGLRQVNFRAELMARLRALPGVQAVGGINDFPLGGGYYANGNFLEMTRPDEIGSYEDVRKLEDVEARTGFAGYRIASADYFRAMGIPLLRGRLFEEMDGPDAPHVAVISESLARARWGDRDPIGRFIQFGNMDGDMRGLRIVGIVGDVREVSPEALPGPLLYADHRQRPASASRFSIVLRGTTDGAVAAAAQRIVRELNSQLPVRVRTAEDALDRALAGRRFGLLLLGVFSAAALVLSIMGIYGVISYLVAQRTREIGIRMALGARDADVLRPIVGQGVLLAVAGTLVGLTATVGLTRVAENLIFGVSARDPASLAGVVLLLMAATVVACWVPARRALRVAPATSLRAE